MQEGLTQLSVHPMLQSAASPITGILWLIPALPVLAAAAISVMKQPRRKIAAGLAVGFWKDFEHLRSCWAEDRTWTPKMNAETREIPVIMLTVRTAVADRIAGLNIGADDYLPKPFDDQELEARIFASWSQATNPTFC